jgi:hypothetical protein
VDGIFRDTCQATPFDSPRTVLEVLVVNGDVSGSRCGTPRRACAHSANAGTFTSGMNHRDTALAFRHPRAIGFAGLVAEGRLGGIPRLATKINDLV